ncbi:SCP-like protein [Ancylostoma caninum]|uniref:SCP-like protein n=1 Tax=Ancylostoma caninum TaxID=29170 RepID=A0A368G0X3_ANCCA|nr:SCP-like protein [Ancylostoma caninum]
MAEEPAESEGEGGGSGRGGAPSMWWLIIAAAALIALAVVAIAIPVFMKRSGGGSTNGLASGNSSAGNSGTGEDHIDMDEFDGDDQNSALQKGMYSGQYVVVIPKDCGTPMTVKMRRSFLLSHNRHRSRAAKGMFTVKNPGSMLHVLPTAARMPALQYNCSLEQLSMKWAHQVQCQMVHSDYDLGENLFAMTGTGEMEHLEEAAETATDVWVEEIDKFGISASLTYESQIGHATQVLWGGTETLGCGVLPCKNGWIMAICEYYPRGNVIGYPMYKAGKTLSECGLGGRREIAHSKTGLCLIS